MQFLSLKCPKLNGLDRIIFLIFFINRILLFWTHIESETASLAETKKFETVFDKYSLLKSIA